LAALAAMATAAAMAGGSDKPPGGGASGVTAVAASAALCGRRLPLAADWVATAEAVDGKGGGAGVDEAATANDLPLVDATEDEWGLAAEFAGVG
jgi:hypothetical protein